MAGVSDKELSFGWLKVRPKWMQFLNTPKWFLFFLCQYFFTQSIIVNGVFPGSLSTIEKRFGYSSYLTGMLTSSYDIAALLLTPLISYIGGSRKKPVFCGCGVFTMGVGFFIFMLPHFITPPYEPDHLFPLDNASAVVSRRLELCLANRTELGVKVDCQKETSGGYMSSYALFVLAMVVAGAGCTPMYALGVPYMDENVKAKVSPMYVGIFLASGIIGSMVGFVVISKFLSIFVELGVQTSLTILDKRWVGNWWLAFAIFGALCVFWSIWLLGFPKEFPLTKKLWERTSAGPIAKDEDALLVALKKLPKATKLVFSSLPFIFITIGVCFDFFVLAFATVFQPKVVEVLFYLPPGKAALLYGVAAGLSGFLGNLAGAYINRRLKLRMTYCARMCFIISFINVVSTGILYIKCETPSIAGVNRPYQDNPGHIQLSSPCNQACNCTGVDYAPVCGGQLSYFSPCHAGCSNLKNTTKDGRSTYSKCTCVQHNGEDPEDATKGTCMVDHVCGLKFTIFLALYALSVFLLLMNFTPGLIVTLRSVPASQESYALGHQMNLTRLLGAIPGPIVVGALLDKTCILWSSKCGEKGYCLEYDHSGMAQVMFGASLICRMISLVCYGLCWLFCRQLEEKEKIAGARGVSDNNCSETCDTGKMHSTSKI